LVVVVGVAVTVAPVALLKLPAGLHVYVFAPLAVIVVLLPKQMVGEAAVKVNVGKGDIVMVTVLLFGHPLPSVAFTVYVMVAVGVATTGVPVEELRVAGEVHV
jgi:hypothetical protein